MKTQKYYTLVGLGDSSTVSQLPVWEILFGDYDRDVVVDECDDCYDTIKTKIITTSDKQADIDLAVKRLNEKNSSQISELIPGEELLLSERFYKVKPLEKTDPVQQNYLVLEVVERKNWSGSNNGATCYTYTKWHQTDDGFVYTHRKGSRKLFDSVEAAFKAGGIGKTVPFYNYLDAPSVGSEKKIISQGWGSDLYCHASNTDWKKVQLSTKSASEIKKIIYDLTDHSNPLTSNTER